MSWCLLVIVSRDGVPLKVQDAVITRLLRPIITFKLKMSHNDASHLSHFSNKPTSPPPPNKDLLDPQTPWDKVRRNFFCTLCDEWKNGEKGRHLVSRHLAREAWVWVPVRGKDATLAFNTQFSEVTDE